MELAGIYLALIATTALCGWGAYAAWRKGHRSAIWTALGLVVAIVALCVYAASVATGSYLAGLGEMIAALSLTLGPGIGIVLGLVTAKWKQVGLALSFFYAFGLAAMMAGIN